MLLTLTDADAGRLLAEQAAQKETIEFAREYEKPYLHINLKKVSGGRAVREILE